MWFAGPGLAVRLLGHLSRAGPRRARLAPRPAFLQAAGHSCGFGPSRELACCQIGGDVVITMGCGDACPVYPAKRYLDWDLPDPAGLDCAAVRPIRDGISRRVLDLISELDVRVVPAMQVDPCAELVFHPAMGN
jgi:hypothetical protein